MSEKNKYEGIEKAQAKALSVVSILMLIIVSLFLYKTYNTNFFNDPENWGVFGDYVGGTLNPILAFLSFMLLLLNLYLQRKQLDKTEEQLELNREELRLTREELKKAADAQIDSAKLMDEQLKTQFLQQFDSLFFSLLNNFKNDLYLIKDSLKIYSQDLTTVLGRINVYHRKKELIVIEAFYELIKTIERRFSSAEFLTEKQRVFYIKQYCNMVRLSLSQDMLYLILLDIIKEENKKLKEVCEKNNIFKYISVDNAREPELKLFIYHLLAQLNFLENTLNERFRQSLIFNFLKCQDFSFYTLMKLCLPLREISNKQKIEFKFNNEFYEIFYDKYAQQWIFENCILKNIQFVWDSIILDFYKKDKNNWDIRLKLSLEIRNNFVVCIDIKKEYPILH